MTFHEVSGLIISLVFVAICAGGFAALVYGVVSTIRDLRV